ncbi:MAG: TRAP transporter permease, partial [Gammaproteobacteria bacterium]|nr:TRAP transporter permease [Gammaproteobacteria bacterium]
MRVDEMNKVEQVMFDVMALGLVLFYSYSAVIAPAATQYHRGIYVIVTYMLVFLVYRLRSPIGRVVDYALII